VLLSLSATIPFITESPKAHTLFNFISISFHLFSNQRRQRYYVCNKMNKYWALRLPFLAERAVLG